MTHSTLDYYHQSKPGMPSKIGCLTLFQAAELSDAISCIRTVCQHIYQSAGHEVPERHIAMLQYFNGATLSLAKAVMIVRLWQRWTGRFSTELPQLVTVEGFLFALRDLRLS